MSHGGLEMIGQPVVGSVEIVTFVFDPGAKVPFAGNQKTMVVTKIIIERITVPEFRLSEIAPDSVGRFILEKLV
jgi:hypothetical protein